MSAYDTPPVRIGNDERQAAVDLLGEHYTLGRLEADEFDERVGAAYAARTQSDLDQLFADLPAGTAAGPTVALPPAPAPMPPMPMPMPQWVPHPAPMPAPYGIEPTTGIPYSDRSKVVAGVLQLLLPFGIGRMYAGNVALGIVQLLSCFFAIGVLWCWIDGIVILAGRPIDQFGRPLRP